MSNQKNSQIQTNISLLNQEKDHFLNQIASSVNELRQKILKSIEKMEKKINRQLSQIFNQSIQLLIKSNPQKNNQLDPSLIKRKVQSFLNSLKTINVDTFIKSVDPIVRQLKQKFQQLPPTIFQKVSPLNFQQNITFKQTLIELENIHINKIFLSNNKLIKVASNGVSGQTNMKINHQKIDYATLIRFPVKNKDYLYLFSEQTLQVYNSKLVIIGKKNIAYEKIIQVVNINDYIFIIESNKIQRIDSMNLNNIKVQLFLQNILLASQKSIQGSLIIYQSNKIKFINNQLETYYQILLTLPNIRNIKTSNKFLLAINGNKVQILLNFQLIFERQVQNIIDVFELYQNALVLISSSGQFFTFKYNVDLNIYQFQHQVKSTKFKTKQALINNNLIYCLSQNGKKIYVYDLV